MALTWPAQSLLGLWPEVVTHRGLQQDLGHGTSGLRGLCGFCTSSGCLTNMGTWGDSAGLGQQEGRGWELVALTRAGCVPGKQEPKRAGVPTSMEVVRALPKPARRVPAPASGQGAASDLNVCLCPGHCRMWGSVPGPHTLHARACHIPMFPDTG